MNKVLIHHQRMLLAHRFPIVTMADGLAEGNWEVWRQGLSRHLPWVANVGAVRKPEPCPCSMN